MGALRELRDNVQEILMEKLKGIFSAGVILQQPELKKRHEFLKHACNITLDPDTAHKNLVLSEGNRVVTTISKVQRYPDHPDRFTECFQVLSSQTLTGRCYWEIKYKGAKACIEVSDKKALRAGASDECTMGSDDKSWALCCVDNTFTLFHNGVHTPLWDSRSCRVEVYLDHSEGLISFYSITAYMVLLHRVVATFTQPLYTGVWFYSMSSSKVEICGLEKTDVWEGVVAESQWLVSHLSPVWASSNLSIFVFFKFQRNQENFTLNVHWTVWLLQM